MSSIEMSTFEILYEYGIRQDYFLVITIGVVYDLTYNYILYIKNNRSVEFKKPLLWIARCLIIMTYMIMYYGFLFDLWEPIEITEIFIKFFILQCVTTLLFIRNWRLYAYIIWQFLAESATLWFLLGITKSLFGYKCLVVI